jgi:DNA polymerase-3 subunit delta'
MFATLVGNERNKEILRRLLRNDRLAATLIFAGPDGVGKRQFALTLAKAANCARAVDGAFDSCDECPACKRVDAGSHGDVRTIRPDGTYIKVAQARELSAEIQFRPFEGRHRFFIIDEADRLREEAANALLKTLEEPPANSSVILITARPDSLLPTILSRSQRLTFAPLSISEMETYLAANYRRPPEDTALLARVCEGRIGQAMAIDLSEYRRERRELIELLELLASGEDRYRLLKAAEYFGKQERDAFERKFDLLARLLRDLILLDAGRPASDIVNIDETQRLTGLSSQIGGRRLIEWVEKFRDLRANLVININRQVAMEAVLLGMGSK